MSAGKSTEKLMDRYIPCRLGENLQAKFDAVSKKQEEENLIETRHIQENLPNLEYEDIEAISSSNDNIGINNNDKFEGIYNNLLQQQIFVDSENDIEGGAQPMNLSTKATENDIEGGAQPMNLSHKGQKHKPKTFKLKENKNDNANKGSSQESMEREILDSKIFRFKKQQRTKLCVEESKELDPLN
eukprot:CAMPEP_0170566460 /NCGR_PEP_ID=MMETSP0211-20121228/79856_1 /TAXON_ID=311385 /ORGANISM="Pseudokeronopsis sp., Strain OXSARD2" /LENGTH=185 /DNA_ID=CAMNT_0010887643 /DNA_START=147 /DNA_END=705 /DNA_ORIENTATION=-